MVVPSQSYAFSSHGSTYFFRQPQCTWTHFVRFCTGVVRMSWRELYERTRLRTVKRVKDNGPWSSKHTIPGVLPLYPTSGASSSDLCSPSSPRGHYLPRVRFVQESCILTYNLCTFIPFLGLLCVRTPIYVLLWGSPTGLS